MEIEIGKNLKELFEIIFGLLVFLLLCIVFIKYF